MRYVVKLVNTCPDGAVVGIEYWIAESESEMEIMIKSDFRGYSTATCLGPVVEPEKWYMNEMEKYIKSINAESSHE